jgi:3-dehydroquinate synthase
MKKIVCHLKGRSYAIHIGEKVSSECGAFLKKEKKVGKLCLVTNPTVARLYAGRLKSSLTKQGFRVETCIVPDSEKAKTERELFKIYDYLVTKNFDRSATIIALGGGVVGDLSGFCAATYMRGIRFINIPTTLLAQVDSAIGGKTGINLPNGKNLVGAFYQPRAVFSDVSFLASLSPQQMSDSLSEVIKYGVIWDARFFEYLEKNIEKARAYDRAVLEHIVATSAQIKVKVVEADERETKGLREILNFGHTFAHAFEAYGAYKKITHGSAVGLGIVVAARLAARLGLLSINESLRIETLIARSGQSTTVTAYFGKRLDPDLFSKKILYYMQFDKKNHNKEIRVVLPRSIGSVSVEKARDLRMVRESIASVVV